MFKPYRFKSGAEAKNRFVLAPLTNTQSPGGALSDDEYNWLSLRIQGGFGIVTTCATHIMPSAQAWDGQLATYDDAHLPGLKGLAVLAQKNDCLVLPQLFHGGFRCPSHLTGVQPSSASEFILNIENFEKPRALTTKEIIQIKNQFVKSAKLAIDAGLPGVEIHGANGYLFTQFLSTQTNQRNDEWGGSIANRARFLIETVKDVRASIGADKILGVRISPENTKLIQGISIEDMQWVSAELAKHNVDYISLSLWSALKKPDQYPDSEKSLLELFRGAIPLETAITVSGQIWTKEDAQKAFMAGADFVALGASGIANPAWPNEVWLTGNEPHRLPMSEIELKEAGVSERFINYIRPRGFVS